MSQVEVEVVVENNELQATIPLSLGPSQMIALQEECEGLRARVSDLEAQLGEARSLLPPASINNLHADLAATRTALEAEQARSRELEGQYAAERARAESYYQDRQDYKLRLREAAAAYSQLKEAYHRLKATTTHSAALQRGNLPPKKEDMDVSPTQADSPDKQRSNRLRVLKTQVPLPSVPRFTGASGDFREPNQPTDGGAAFVTAKALDKTAVNAVGSVRQAAAMAALAAVGEVPPRKPAWKKAVRAGEGPDAFDDNRDFLLPAKRPRKRSKESSFSLLDDDEADRAKEDPFLQSPVKKYVPDPEYVIAQPATNATAAVEGIAGPENAKKPAAGEPVIKRQQVVRRKEDRANLQGYECQDCKRFYEALEKWGAIAVGGLPACQHANQSGPQAMPPPQPLAAAARNELRQGASRHRYVHEPPPTPKGYWDLGLSPPKEAE